MSERGPRLQWPGGGLSKIDVQQQWATLRPVFLEAMRAHQLPAEQADRLVDVYLNLAAWVLRQKRGGTLTVGINGAQGAGKSTLCSFLALVLEHVYRQRVAGFSIDDLYKTRAERERLAHEVHPLFITRGPPGTHDIDLGLNTLTRLHTATADSHTPMPAFDKAADDRRPRADWPMFTGRPDIIIVEGWCVGIPPEPEANLRLPMNALEAEADRDGHWRQTINRALTESYPALFRQLDRLIFLKVPDMNRVFEWRGLQEQKLVASFGTGPDRRMDETALRRFIMHYERLTRHALATLPGLADLTLELDASHAVARVLEKPVG